jgi:hypothetical protein
MIGSLQGRKVRTLDDTLRAFQDRDLNSPVIGQLPAGVEIQLGAVSEIEGREWVEATLPDGTAGFLVSASDRRHTEAADESVPFNPENRNSQQAPHAPSDSKTTSGTKSEYGGLLEFKSVWAEFNARFADKEQLNVKELCEFRRYAKSCTDLQSEDLTPEEAAWKMMYDYLTAQVETLAPGLLKEIQPVHERLDNIERLEEMIDAKLKARPNDLGFKVSWGFLIAGLVVGWLRSSDFALTLLHGFVFWVAGLLFSIFILDSALVQGVTGDCFGKIGLRAIANWLRYRSLTIRYTEEEVEAEFLRLSEGLGNPESAQMRRKSKVKLNQLAETYPEAARRALDRRMEGTLHEYGKIVEPLLQGNNEVDLSGAAAKIREQMGLPLTGSVRDLPGVEEDIADALDYIDAHAGKVPFKEVVKIAAAIDPKSPQAYFLRYRSERNLPPL